MNPFERISAEKVFAVLRIHETKKAKDIIKALYDGGIKTVEIVLETPEMVKVMEEIAKQNERPMLMAGVKQILRLNPVVMLLFHLFFK